MVKAFGHAPRTYLGTPTASVFGEVFHEHPRVALGCVELVFQIPDVLRQFCHVPYCMVWEGKLSILLGMGEFNTMAHKGTGAKRLDQATLTSADWVEGAIQLISEAGLRALTVEALAARLGVTKGSFYWHFKGRSELLAGALGRWEHRATTEAIAGLSAVTDARQRLILMLDAATQPPRSRSLYAALAGPQTIRL